MLDLLIGPPPGLHGTLMQREMCDPSEALPVIVAEFIAPMHAEMAEIVVRLAPGASRKAVERCVFSIIGQVLFYRFTMPAMLLLQGIETYPRGYARELAEHITEFSLGGLVPGVRPSQPEAACALERLAVAVLIALSACATLTRPEGDGGWSAERRREELARRAVTAGVALEPMPEPPSSPTEPLDLAGALSLAAHSNRRIAAGGARARCRGGARA